MAMNRSRRPRIREEEWESYKSTIKTLFLDEGKAVVGEDGLIKIMSREHGFVARYLIDSPSTGQI